VTIPVYATGHTPVVVVVPDIPKLAERIALGALSVPGRIIRGGVNGLSNLIGGGSSFRYQDALEFKSARRTKRPATLE
jgi:hypothetical protein